MKGFRYARPTNLADALALLEEHGPRARVLSGGTDLFVGLRKGKLDAEVVIDLKAIAEIPDGVVETDRGLEIGATAVMTDVIEDERIRSRFPALVEAAVTVGSIQIRNRATFAGNVCNASPAADTVLPLLVYGAEVELASADGNRRVPLDDFLQGPGRTDLRAGELVVSIALPTPRSARGSAFARMTRRRGVDLATVNVCCSVAEEGTTRFALGAVGPRALLVQDESGRLADPTLPPEEQEALLEPLLRRATPITDVRGSKDYREGMLRVLARRTLATARARLDAGVMA